MTDAGSRLGPDAALREIQESVRAIHAAALGNQPMWRVEGMLHALVDLLELKIRDAVARGTVPGEPDDTVTKAVVYARTALEDACRLIETGDARLLASDGPAGDRPPELSLAEWRKLYVTLDKARKRLWAIASRIVAARGEASESRSAPPNYAYSDQRPLPVDLSRFESRSVGASEIPVRRPWGNDVRGWLRTQLTYVRPLIAQAWTERTAEDFEAAIWAALDGVRAGEGEPK